MSVLFWRGLQGICPVVGEGRASGNHVLIEHGPDCVVIWLGLWRVVVVFVVVADVEGDPVGRSVVRVGLLASLGDEGRVEPLAFERMQAEAEERGLLNLRTTADALPYLADKDVKALFKKYGVLSAR